MSFKDIETLYRCDAECKCGADRFSYTKCQYKVECVSASDYHINTFVDQLYKLSLIEKNETFDSCAAFRTETILAWVWKC